MSHSVVLIGEAIGEANLAQLADSHPNLAFRYCVERERYLANVPDAEIIFSGSIVYRLSPIVYRLTQKE